ncbi:hypothetical protein [Mycobacterium sp. 236(2023)]|uniref:hypothetical protein n=1 Tax=Mycobacterium sp. 236(2023) TaxID=3038163 RepID=UPI0024153EA9|nr:hypothetical protein [Mycobacterium sp. 236(2023)]MDG4665428.1 hypothetical protein [Mycobacterium sp. 236(2023)]
MTTLHQVELGVLGPLHVRQFGLPVAIPGAKPRAVLTMLGLHGGAVVAADTWWNFSGVTNRPAPRRKRSRPTSPRFAGRSVTASVDGDLTDRCELFDETDLDAALARFDELSTKAHLQNAATTVCRCVRTAFAARHWDVVAQLLAEDLHNEARGERRDPSRAGNDARRHADRRRPRCPRL